MEKERIWDLITRKLTREASEKELEELESLLKKFPELTYAIQVIEDLWRSHPTIDPEEIRRAFEQHLFRMLGKATQPAALESSSWPTAQSSQPLPIPGQLPSKNRDFLNKPASKNVRLYEWLRRKMDLLQNYFKIARRSLFRNLGFSSLNVTGLAIGMASAILILLWIQHEMSFDQFHEKKGRIYLLCNRGVYNGKLETSMGVPMVLTPLLKTGYPQVEEVSRINGVAPFVMSVGDRHFPAPNGMMVDPGFLKIFSFPLVRGNLEQALQSPRSILITEKFAKEVFPGKDAMGQVIRIDSNAYFKVDGIMKDPPNNTVLYFDYLLPYSYMKEVHWDRQDWTDNSVMTFVLLKPGVTERAGNAGLRDAIKTHAPVANEVFLHPITKWHLYSTFENGKIVGGGIDAVRLFGIIAGFILLIACINYMNLSTAQSVKRAKEVGVRKVVGAGKISIIIRFLGESILISLISGLIAVIIVQLTIQGFNWLTQDNLVIPYGNPYFWFALFGFILFTGLIAGSYPAFYLSTYKPISVLKGTFKTAFSLVSVRKVLVVFQFCIAIFFMICTIIIYRQINYASRRDPGYDRDHLAFAYVNGEVNNKYQLIRHDLLSGGAATAVTRSNSPITYIWSGDDRYSWQGSDPNKKVYFNEFHADNDFLETTGLKLISGRTINTNIYPTDSTAILLNESAVAAMGLKNPLGEILRSPQGNWTVIGVVKDFVPGSPFVSTQPLIIQGPKNWFGAVTFRLNKNYSLADNMKKVEAVFKKYNPQYPFIYRFVDEADAEKFEGERRTGIQSALFGGMAILISCLGLFGLSAFMAENRVKEIGVRKVLGATVFTLWQLLSREFVLLVMIAFAIASPVAYYLMQSWMQDYSYRANISWWIFALAGTCAIVVTLSTVSVQAVKAAMANPVKSLRAE